MINNSIGYIICESDITTQVTNIVPQKVNGKLVGEGILQTANEKNRNGRFYSSEELFPQLRAPRTIELLEKGYLRAEMGHPLSKDLQRQATIDDTKTCARFLKLWTEGDNIWATFTATNNKYGEAFNADLAEGCLPAWSLRALGSVCQTSRGAEVKNLRIITWDQVIYPSHPGAYTQRLIGESAVLNESTIIEEGEKNDVSGTPLIIPITNDKIISFIQQESSNLKFVRECFDFVYDSIQMNEAGTKVILNTNQGETLVVNVENYIHRELMDYASNRLDFIEENTRQERRERKEVAKVAAGVIKDFVRSSGVKLNPSNTWNTGRMFKKDQVDYVDYVFSNMGGDMLVAALMQAVCPIYCTNAVSAAYIPKLRALLGKDSNIKKLQDMIQKRIPDYTIKISQYNKSKDTLRIHFQIKQ